MPDTALPTLPEDEIDPSLFQLMVDVRYKALQIAMNMPNATTSATIFKKAEEIERWLARKA